MLWFLKVPILGWVLRKGLKKAGCFWVFFQPLLVELESFYCETQTTVDPPDRLLNFFILPTWLPTVSHSMQIERTHSDKMLHLSVICQSGQVPEKISQASVIRDVVQGELLAMNWMRVDSGLPWKTLKDSGWIWGWGDCCLMSLEGLFLSSLKDRRNWGGVFFVERQMFHSLQNRPKDKPWNCRMVLLASVPVEWVLLEHTSEHVSDKIMTGHSRDGFVKD